jgi:hypothetical protein
MNSVAKLGTHQGPHRVRVRGATAAAKESQTTSIARF